ncbi:polysaccharide biosynthesis protein [Amylibacter sp.]|nr:polysaccharide biosynthesis protein [Amylibacter sp.]
MSTLAILERDNLLFENDLAKFDQQICQIIQESRFLVIGGGGTIGQAVTKEIFRRKAKAVHVVDLSENYLVELVRDLRSSFGHLVEDFDTHAIDCGCSTFEDFMSIGRYDYVLNLSALKHVRSENCPFTMLRMINSNIKNTLSTYDYAKKFEAKKYFCVSTDKAANPANFMGATKRAMELSLMRRDLALPVVGARFANVAFSNGSLLESFRFRIEKKQPLSMPNDISRFFVTQQEAGLICLFATILGDTNEIFFPYNKNEMKLTMFTEIAKNYLFSLGKEPVFCYAEEEARDLISKLDLSKQWPVNVFQSDTVGEKPFEEFYTSIEEIRYEKFTDLATINFYSDKSEDEIREFLRRIDNINLHMCSARVEFVDALKRFVPSFEHVDTNRFLNSRM